jgi:hydroxymethylglutaryl-CoA synthase
MNLKKDNCAGIVSYGAYIPRYRITVKEIATAWDADAKSFENGLGLIEKSVPALDEDTVTISANCAVQAMQRCKNQSAIKIEAVYVGSESHPYAVKPTSTMVGEALNIGSDWTASDLEFACKAGTAGMQMVFGLVEAGRIENGIAIGADTAQGAPGDALEYSAAAGGAAFIIGKEKIIAKLIHTTSMTSDTPDFWRRKMEHFPKHGGRFTGEPAYFKHVVSNTKKILADTGMKIDEFAHIVFHMPNGKFPMAVAKTFGATKQQMQAGFIVKYVGNTYSACSMLGLSSILDVAKPGEMVLVSSYGSGSGSDSFIFEITEEIEKYRNYYNTLDSDMSVTEQLEKKIYIPYGRYVRHTEKLVD